MSKWGPGRSVGTGDFEQRPIDETNMPEHLCGGTYWSRKKRKRGSKESEKLTYAERKQRRIEKKFGVAGNELGSDELLRISLEKGRRAPGKPKVAQSKRGRELRAQAALARFGQNNQAPVKDEQTKLPFKKEDSPDVKVEETDPELDIETESEDEGDGPDAVDHNGQSLQDSEGCGMVKVCEDEDHDDPEVKSELKELQALYDIPVAQPSEPVPSIDRSRAGSNSKVRTPDVPSHKSQPTTQPPERSVETNSAQQGPNNTITPSDTLTPGTCLACSFANDVNALTCMACANVSKPDKAPGHWTCTSKQCQGSSYIHSGDVGRCGICGAVRVK